MDKCTHEPACYTYRDHIEKSGEETDPDNDLLDDPMCNCGFVAWACQCYYLNNVQETT